MPNLPDDRDRADQLGGRGLRPAPGQVLGFGQDVRSNRSTSSGDNDIDSNLVDLHNHDIRSFQRNTNGTIEIELNDGSTIAGAKDLHAVRRRGLWSSSTTYVENDLVYRSISGVDHWYVAIRDVQNNVQPGGSTTWTADWQEIGRSGGLNLPMWSSLTGSIEKGTIVEHNNDAYMARTTHNKGSVGPDGDRTNWWSLADWRGEIHTAGYFPAGSEGYTGTGDTLAIWKATDFLVPDDPLPTDVANTKWKKIWPADTPTPDAAIPALQAAVQDIIVGDIVDHNWQDVNSDGSEGGVGENHDTTNAAARGATYSSPSFTDGNTDNFILLRIPRDSDVRHYQIVISGVEGAIGANLLLALGHSVDNNWSYYGYGYAEINAFAGAHHTVTLQISDRVLAHTTFAGRLDEEPLVQVADLLTLRRGSETKTSNSQLLQADLGRVIVVAPQDTDRKTITLPEVTADQIGAMVRFVFQLDAQETATIQAANSGTVVGIEEGGDSSIRVTADDNGNVIDVQVTGADAWRVVNHYIGNIAASQSDLNALQDDLERQIESFASHQEQVVSELPDPTLPESPGFAWLARKWEPTQGATGAQGQVSYSVGEYEKTEGTANRVKVRMSKQAFAGQTIWGFAQRGDRLVTVGDRPVPNLGECIHNPLGGAMPALYMVPWNLTAGTHEYWSCWVKTDLVQGGNPWPIPSPTPQNNFDRFRVRVYYQQGNSTLNFDIPLSVGDHGSVRRIIDGVSYTQMFSNINTQNQAGEGWIKGLDVNDIDASTVEIEFAHVINGTTIRPLWLGGTAEGWTWRDPSEVPNTTARIQRIERASMVPGQLIADLTGADGAANLDERPWGVQGGVSGVRHGNGQGNTSGSWSKYLYLDCDVFAQSVASGSNGVIVEATRSGTVISTVFIPWTLFSANWDADHQFFAGKTNTGKTNAATLYASCGVNNGEFHLRLAGGNASSALRVNIYRNN